MDFIDRATYNDDQNEAFDYHDHQFHRLMLTFHYAEQSAHRNHLNCGDCFEISQVVIDLYTENNRDRLETAVEPDRGQCRG